MHIDDTRFDTPTPTYQPEGGHQPTSLIPHLSSRRSRRRALGFAMLVAAMMFVGAWFASASVSSSDDVDVAAGAAEAPSDVDAATPETETSPAPVVDEDQPVPAEEEPAAEPEPEPEPEPADPCDLLADGQTLAVSAEAIELPVGQYAGELLVTNCDEEPTQWTAHTLSPDVQLGVAGGMLAAGATVDVQFALDPSAIVGSKLSFFITVSEAGFETKVMVTATKPMLNPGIQIPKLELQLDL